MKTLAMFVAIQASAIYVAAAIAQMQVPPPSEPTSPPPRATAPSQGAENAVEGRVESVDPTRTEITLSDGTKLATPPGSVLRPGVVTAGMVVVASYREENGLKILTGLAVKDRGPATR
jgi:hypothetical protein